MLDHGPVHTPMFWLVVWVNQWEQTDTCFIASKTMANEPNTAWCRHRYHIYFTDMIFLTNFSFVWVTCFWPVCLFNGQDCYTIGALDWLHWRSKSFNFLAVGKFLSMHLKFIGCCFSLVPINLKPSLRKHCHCSNVFASKIHYSFSFLCHWRRT
jgi:hypothetical protein